MDRTASENQLGLGLVMLGAIAIAIAAFLPLDEPTGAFATVQSNTLIQHGGWALVSLGLGVASAGYRLSMGKTKWGWPVALCFATGIVVVAFANSDDLRTLYPIGQDGTPDTSQPGTVASLGVAIYVAGAGVAAAAIGSLMLQQAQQHARVRESEALVRLASMEETHQHERESDALVSLALADAIASEGELASDTKRCPDCAEAVLAEARVCKHCGYRFAPPLT
jgi:hypothetical protein